jgi:hypothetical protein
VGTELFHAEEQTDRQTHMIKLMVKKIKFALEQAMKAQRESRGIALLFL